MVFILALICILVNALTRVSRQHSLTLEDYANQNPDIAYQKNTEKETVSGSDSKQDAPTLSSLPGAALNSSIPNNQRTLYAEGFYYEPLSENLQRYITGISYPVFPQQDADASQGSDPHLDITYDDLRYVHIWHYNFVGTPTEG